MLGAELAPPIYVLKVLMLAGDLYAYSPWEHPEFLTDIASIRLSCDFLDKMMIK
jgi:hypothetical protein